MKDQIRWRVLQVIAVFNGQTKYTFSVPKQNDTHKCVWCSSSRNVSKHYKIMTWRDNDNDEDEDDNADDESRVIITLNVLRLEEVLVTQRWIKTRRPLGDGDGLPLSRGDAWRRDGRGVAVLRLMTEHLWSRQNFQSVNLSPLHIVEPVKQQQWRWYQKFDTPLYSQRQLNW